MLAHSLGAGGIAFACLAAIARDKFSLGYSTVWDLGWAAVGFLICWFVLLRARYRGKNRFSGSASR